MQTQDEKIYSNCPNCNESLTNSFMKSKYMIAEIYIDYINLYNNTKSEGYCNKCAKLLVPQTNSLFYKEKASIEAKMSEIISSIPVVSIQSPIGWEFEVLEMVTGQSVTGTGVISEFTSVFTDLFGKQSNRYNSKLKSGEELCFAQLRKNALDIGGNAVIATDIDYAEVGGSKGMLMVCMAGTAIKLKNTEKLGTKRSDDILELVKLNNRINVLSSFNLIESKDFDYAFEYANYIPQK